jgi:hypothetical protein
MVRVPADRHFGDVLQCPEIEDDDRARVAFADEPAAEFARHGGAMHVGSAADRPHDGIGVQIDHGHFLVVADVQTATVHVRCRVIPPVIAGNGDRLQKVISRSARRTHREYKDDRHPFVHRELLF